MKKSEINPEEFLREIKSAINLADEIKTIDLEDKEALLKIKEKAEAQKQKIKDKYQKLISENSENNLDSKE
tara:strand:+ start:276 stop:488 length:213 start_codon:yes stop_codon:yes gene_type:complete